MQLAATRVAKCLRWGIWPLPPLPAGPYTPVPCRGWPCPVVRLQEEILKKLQFLLHQWTKAGAQQPPHLPWPTTADKPSLDMAKLQGSVLIFLCSRSYVIKVTALHILQCVASLRHLPGDPQRTRTPDPASESTVAELIEEKAGSIVAESAALVRRLKETAFDWTDGVTGTAGLRRINTLGSSTGSNSGPTRARGLSGGESRPAPAAATGDIPQTKSKEWKPGFEPIQQWLLSPWWYIMLACLISACATHTPGVIRFSLHYLYIRLVFHQRHLQVAHKEEVTPEERVRIELWRNYAIFACAGCSVQVQP